MVNKYFYSFIVFIVLSFFVYFGDFFKKNYLETNDEYKLIQTYLLNESPLYGYDKPKLWIHTKYDINARKWKSFQSRNTTDLNQPFLHLTIKTIVNHCSQDFNICLIDDDTFEKLLPNWDVKVGEVAEPVRSRIRELGLLKLVYYYGGMVVPNSFICCRNLKEMYDQETDGNRAFVCENVNRAEHATYDKKRRVFMPDLYCFGAKKNNPVIKEWVEFSKTENKVPHFSAETEFFGTSSLFALALAKEGKINVVDGKKMGVKTADNKIVGIEELMGEGFLNLDARPYGVYLPADAILARTCYSWFSVLSKEELLSSNVIAVKYIVASLVDEYKNTREKRELRSVVAI